MNGGVCSSRKHCLCLPGFTGRLCQFPLQQTQQAQAARGNKQPVYPVALKPEGRHMVEQLSIGRTQFTQTHSVLTLPMSHSSEVQFNVRVHHAPDTSVVIQPLDQSDAKPPPPHKPRQFTVRHKPKGRCFQETTPKQACNSTPLPVLTNQEDCCGSVGNSWGQNKCYQCPKLPSECASCTAYAYFIYFICILHILHMHTQLNILHILHMHTYTKHTSYTSYAYSTKHTSYTSYAYFICILN
ncbi:Latent-transforming growth factor beta-binding protein 3 [Liparis tanakae]|uniref:Latent-transforming growth factor beta-binding protein 3 n=1 Tax=Liparis tanakae TaxID=230148 RepID=A0A4Z2EE26_9TELE|nr:Latent-transforming growth factor beta-binding protein 3 [Liparis tanakae]